MQTCETYEEFGELFLFCYFPQSARIYCVPLRWYVTPLKMKPFLLISHSIYLLSTYHGNMHRNTESWGIKKVFPSSFSHVFAKIAWYYSQIFPFCLILIDSATNATKMFVLFVQSNGIIIWNVQKVEGVW